MSFQPQPQQNSQARGPQRSRDGRTQRDNSRTPAHNGQHNVDRAPRGGSRNEGASANANGAPRALLIGLLVLAVLATILMLFLDSELWLKIAVFCSLWAAFIGAWLVTRYSSALDAERDRSKQMQRTHAAELKREESAHKEREAMLESSYEQRIRDQRDEHIEQLRQELAVMRQQLAAMSGQDLGTEQTSVRARAERVREIENNAGQPASSSATDKTSVFAPANGAAANGAQAGHAASKASTSQSAQSAQSGEHTAKVSRPKFSTGSFNAIKWDGQDHQETAHLPLIVDTTAMDEDEQRPDHHAPAAKHVHHHAAPSADNDSKDSAKSTSSYTAAHAGKNGDSQSTPQSASQPQSPSYVGGHRRRDDAAEQKGTHGRRRADDSGAGLTVAELMARFKKDKKD